MGFMDELKKLARPYGEDEEDFDDFDLEEQPRSSRASTAPRASVFDDPVEEAPSRPAFGSRRNSEPKVVNLGSASNAAQVILMKTDRFDTVSEIAEHLRNRRAVVVNMEATNKDVARRVVDFLSGCAFALDGKIKKVAVLTYLVTPHNVDIVSEMLDDLETGNEYL